MAFFGVNFILQKFCPCKKNDKYQVWGGGVYWDPKFVLRNKWTAPYWPTTLYKGIKALFLSHAQYTWSSYFLSLKSQISRKHFFPLFSSFGKKNDFPFLYSTLQCYVMYWRRDVSLSTKVAQEHVKHARKNLCAP